jgi:hypothetical protein
LFLPVNKTRFTDGRLQSPTEPCYRAGLTIAFSNTILFRHAPSGIYIPSNKYFASEVAEAGSVLRSRRAKTEVLSTSGRSESRSPPRIK